MNNDSLITRIANDLADQGYSSQMDVFSNSIVSALQQEALHLQQQGAFKTAGIGHDDILTIKKNIRRDKILWLDDAPDNPNLSIFIKFLENLKAGLNKRLFLGLKDYEAHFAVYEPGDFYAKHRDRFQKQDTRQVSLVFYLNPQWCEADGGELVLYGEKDIPKLVISPIANRLVCFLSDHLHEVKPVNRKRVSITAWFLCRDIINPIKQLLD